MKISKYLSGVASVVALTVLAAGSAFGATETAIGVASGNSVTYTAGPNGGITVTALNTSSYKNYLTNTTIQPTTVVFTGMGNAYVNGSPVYTPPDPVTGQYSQELNPGSFTIMSGSTVLLSGNFQYSNLTGVDQSGQPLGTPGTSADAGVQLVTDSLTYTGGTEFDPTKFSSSNGTLSFEFTSTGPIVASSTQVNNFIATDGITFEAVPLAAPPGVPEPASLVGLAVGLLLLAGLALRAKQRRGFRAA